jgi:hypothetical protein
VSLHAHNQANGQLKIQLKEKKIYKQKTTAGTGSGFEQVQGQSAVSSQAHKQAVGHLKIHVKRKSFYKEKTTAGTSSVCE